ADSGGETGRSANPAALYTEPVTPSVNRTDRSSEKSGRSARPAVPPTGKHSPFDTPIVCWSERSASSTLRTARSGGGTLGPATGLLLHLKVCSVLTEEAQNL